MSARSVLWVDLRTNPGKPDLCSSLPKSYRAQRVSRISDILRAISDWLPWAVCFEFDNPDAHGLEALAEVKCRYSSLPVVMLTGRHTESLASWALRCCVWDYLVKPLAVRHLCNCLTSIDRTVPRLNHWASGIAPCRVEVDVQAKKSAQNGPLGPAMSYVESNYAEKIRLATAAKLCDLSPFQFSRYFKKENGLTFRAFVVKRRIHRAAQLMTESAVSVTEAAFVVGFNDLSYFARMFRRQLGVSPSHYRSESESGQLLLFPPLAEQQEAQESTSPTARKS
jgi:YesN/AraC family two-component response regulator